MLCGLLTPCIRGGGGDLRRHLPRPKIFPQGDTRDRWTLVFYENDFQWWPAAACAGARVDRLTWSPGYSRYCLLSSPESVIGYANMQGIGTPGAARAFIRDVALQLNDITAVSEAGNTRCAASVPEKAREGGEGNN